MRNTNSVQQAAPCRILSAYDEHHYDDARALMTEYRELALADDYHIAGAGLNEELAQFPKPYVAPKGCILLAYRNEQAVGCLAIRPINEITGEVMRMYVKEEMRGYGIANQLMLATLNAAREMGYVQLYLDSLNRFKEAHALYLKHGFTFCEPYDAATTPEMAQHMVFMNKIL